MGMRRSFITWLLLIGLVGVYARSYEELSTNDLQLDESSSALNPVNDDFASVDGVISQLGTTRIFKRSDPKPSQSGMSKQDLEWHIDEGVKAMKRLSETPAFDNEAALWKYRREEEKQKKNAAKAALRRITQQRNVPKVDKQTQTSLNSPSRRS